MSDMPSNLKTAFIGIFGLLILASVTLPFFKRVLKHDNYMELKQRIKSWWIMVIVFTHWGPRKTAEKDQTV